MKSLILLIALFVTGFTYAEEYPEFSESYFCNDGSVITFKIAKVSSQTVLSTNLDLIYLPAPIIINGEEQRFEGKMNLCGRGNPFCSNQKYTATSTNEDIQINYSLEYGPYASSGKPSSDLKMKIDLIVLPNGDLNVEYLLTKISRADGRFGSGFTSKLCRPI